MTGAVPARAIYAVPVLGILLILLSDDTWKFSEAWISLSFVLYFLLVVLAVVVQVPAIRKMVAVRSGADGAQPLQMQAEAKKVAAVSGIVNVLWVVILFLMVFKPGH